MSIQAPKLRLQAPRSSLANLNAGPKEGPALTKPRGPLTASSRGNEKAVAQGQPARTKRKRPVAGAAGADARKRHKPNRPARGGRGWNASSHVRSRAPKSYQANGRGRGADARRVNKAAPPRKPAPGAAAARRSARHPPARTAGASAQGSRPATARQRPKRSGMPGGLRDQIERKSAKITEQKGEIGTLRRQNLDLEGAMASAERRHAASVEEVRERFAVKLDTQKQKIEELQHKYTSEKDAHATLRQQFEELQRQRDAALKEHASELRAKQAALQEQEQFVRDHKKLLGEAKRQYEDSQAKLEAEKSRTAELESQIADEQAKLQESSERITNLEAEQRRVNAVLDGYKEEVKRHKAVIAEHEENIRKLTAELEQQRLKAAQDEEVRRGLHNQILELKGNIRVFCRVRPFLKEKGEPVYAYPEHAHKGGIHIKAPATGVAAMHQDKSYNFEFDRVFGPQNGQVEVFREIEGLVRSALDGYKVCVFAYGQTGAGKTHTMLGQSMDPRDENRGMIPRAVEQVFNHSLGMASKGWHFTCNASFMEIYNEKIHDLLCARKPGQEPESLGLQMRNRANRNLVEVAGLTSVPVKTAQDVYPLLSKANENRQAAATDCNERSSRSHSIFRMHIHGVNSMSQQNRYGVLNLIDLAGSERLKLSGSQGDRMREAQAINKSLACLGDVIMAISKKNKHVPYRNSKLTHLLQNCFGGDAKTLMFMNLCPEAGRFEESLSTLRFAAKVNDCHIGIARRNISGQKGR